MRKRKSRPPAPGEAPLSERGVESARGSESARVQESARAKSSAPPPPDDALGRAIWEAKRAPQDDEKWDAVEEQARLTDRPEEVAALYRVILRDLDRPELVTRLGQRAVRFHDEWFEDAAPLADILSRVVEADANAVWAFDRLVMLYTTASRWDELLGLYDRALAAETDKLRRMQLLDEAAHVAKDFAAQPDRAIDYLRQLLPLKPNDAQLATSLERLLDRQKRHRDLIELWTSRVAVLPRDGKLAMRAKIASAWLDKLDLPAEALAAIEALVPDDPHDTYVPKLLERIVASPSAERDVRRRAIGLLKERYARAKKGEDVVRVLRVLLDGAEREEKIALHTEIAARLVELGRAAEAIEDCAAVVVLDPSSTEARTRLRELADATGRHDRYAQALSAAVDATHDGATQLELLVEAARVRADVLADAPEAIRLLARALEIQGDPAITLDVARRLVALLESTGRAREQLEVLERLATLETEETTRRAAIARAARLADELGDPDRALVSWARILDADATDAEALDATIDVLERVQNWGALIEALRRRAAATSDAAGKRRDRVRVARVQWEKLQALDDSIASWRAIEDEFGADAETVDALDALFAAAQRWDDAATLLSTAAEREIDGARRVEWLRRLGDVHRSRLNAPARAVQEYARALEIDPRDAGSRSGLLALLDDDIADASDVTAAEALAGAFQRTDEWQRMLDVVEHRLRVARDDAARAAILREAAQIEERRANDAHAALRSNCRAFPLAASDLALEQELLRLAQSTGSWSHAVEAYANAIAASSKDSLRVAALRLQQGSILERRVGDGEAALAAYSPVLRAYPESMEAAEAVVRVAAKTHQWEVAAQAIVDSTRARGRLEYALVTALEPIVEEASGWEPLTSAFEHAIHAADLAVANARELETQLALWHRDRRHDADAAERALVRASRDEATDAATLRMLAVLQRRHPDAALLETLLRLADATNDDLGVLYEAAEVALDAVKEPARGEAILVRLLKNASARWTGRHSLPTLPPQSVQPSALADGLPTAESLSSWALDRLVTLQVETGKHARAVELLVEHSRLPFPAAVARALRRRAAEIAARELHDVTRAIELHRALLDEAPDDRPSIAQLAALYREGGKLQELAALLRHELELVTDVDERLGIRLDLAGVLGALGDEEARIEALRENLAERAGDERSIAALTEVLHATAAHATLANVLAEQALRLETSGDTARATDLWSRVAALAESHLGDLDRAIESWRRVVTLGEAAGAPHVMQALDALANLYAQRGDNATAIEWLERRLARTATNERAPTVVRLARAHLASGDRERALFTLESSLAGDPSPREVRDLLASILREGGSWEALRTLLVDGTAHTNDPAARLAYLREAAEISQQRLGEAERAIPLLEEATRAAPNDRSLRVALADALRIAGRLDEARAMLDALVEEYGRRRPPERAAVHVQLAQVAEARGDLKEALAQLDLAASIDLGHVRTLRMLAALARRAGDLPRAEKAYRTLLMQVRRAAMAAEAGVGPAEVLFELYRIAADQQQPDRARETLESAFDAASQNEDDAARLTEALRGSGEDELFLRALQTRLATVQDPTAVASILSEISAVSERLGRVDDAMDAVLRALEQMPTSGALHDAARALAARTQRLARYADFVEDLVERTAAGGDASGSAALLFRLGELFEHELNDLQRAAKAYERAESAGERVIDAWRALDRIYSSLGDAAGQVRVLRALVQQAPEDATTNATTNEKTESLYRLAALELSRSETHDDAVEMLSWALDREPQLERAAALLRRDREPNAKSLALYERVARAANDAAWLLDALERRAQMNGADAPAPETMREAVELATKLGDEARVESLLQRAILLASSDDANPADAVWAHVATAERRKATNDFAGAVASLRAAAESAGESGDAVTYTLEAASLAAGPANDLPLAAQLYEKLRARDPGDRNAWAPLLEVHRKLGDRAAVERVIAETVDNVFDASERNLLRVEHARILLDDPARRDEAIRSLREIVDEDPDDKNAVTLLADVLEKDGRGDELADLLARQLDQARARNTLDVIVALSLRLGALLEKTRRDEAMDVYRQASVAAPDDRDVLAALVKLFKPTDDAHERADWMERLLAVEKGDRAAALALDLVKLRESIHDDEGAVRALERGFAEAPQQEKIRSRLEKLYAERGDFAKLAQLVTHDASSRKDKKLAVARFRDAAKIYSEKLGDPRSAAETLRKARVVAPDDVTLLGETCKALGAAGDVEGAIAELGRALDEAKLPDASRAQLLKTRAELRATRGDESGSIEDYEAAFVLAGKNVGPDLAQALDRRRASAHARNDREAERTATMRLVDVLTSTGDGERAHEVLLEWAERAPDDRAALQRLAAHDAAAERWHGVIEAYRRLVALEEGEAQVAAALALADAATRAGAPESAREGLEHAFRGNPQNQAIRAQLRDIYLAVGAHLELAQLALVEAESTTDDEARFARFLEAGDMFLQAGDLTAALAPLERALQLKPAHQDATLLLADAYTMNGQIDDAMGLLQPAIDRFKGKRTKEAAALMHRMARAANAGGGHDVELQWLQKALDCDMQNGQVAAELAEVAMELRHWDIALKALKAVTLLKTPGPMSKAMANLRQGMIAHEQGDVRRAVVLAKTALAQDPKLAEAADFLRRLGTT